ncbi:hypothetical protein KAR91_15455 [Candidatus Pacearchaeota archaeon]|nr:hypothetical protein [Candidatus Pacearchaeota archaeon]
MPDLHETSTGKKTTLQYVDPDGTSIELLKIDATQSLEHRMSAKATRHEIEDGGFVSDHVILNGRSLTIQGVISDNPINLLEAASGNISGVVGGVAGGVVGAVATGVISKIGSDLISNGEEKPSVDAMSMLDLVYENKIPLTIITGLKTYVNMIMESFTAPQNPRNAGSLNFTGSFTEVRIIESEEVDIPAVSTDNEGAIKTKTEGKKPVEELNEATTEKGSSLLFKILGD